MSKPALSYAEMMEAADAFLHEEWRELRNGAGAGELLNFSGMVRALNAVAILSDDQRELWGRRHTNCPGHDDEGGRDWCAFCGEMPRDADEFPVLPITAPDCDATCVSCQAGDHGECGVGCHADELAACYVQEEDPAAAAAWSQRQQREQRQGDLAGPLHLGRDDVLRCGVCAETLGAAAEYTTDQQYERSPGCFAPAAFCRFCPPKPEPGAPEEPDEEPADDDRKDMSDVPMVHELADDERGPYLDASDFWREAV